MAQFLSNCPKVGQIIKGLRLTKSLLVSSALIGEAHTGKKALVRSVFPDAPLVSGKDKKRVLEILNEHDELIVVDFEHVNYFDQIDFSNKRVIAVGNAISNSREADRLFGFIYRMPPLRERPEDIALLGERFRQEALETMMLPDHVQCESCRFDVSDNIRSLKASVYKQLLFHHIDDESIQEVLYTYFFKKFSKNISYKELLSIIERPMIEAGLSRFGSQLKLSQALQINRNTLRKKIHEHGID